MDTGFDFGLFNQVAKAEGKWRYGDASAKTYENKTELTNYKRHDNGKGFCSKKRLFYWVDYGECNPFLQKA